MTSRILRAFAGAGLLVAGVVSWAVAAELARQVAVRSPSERVEITITPPRAGDANSAPGFAVRFRGRELLRQSSLGLAVLGAIPRPGLKGGVAETEDLLAGAKLTKVKFDSHDETYRVVAGKRNPIRNHYRQAALTFRSSRALTSQVFIRVFDDSVAIRYSIPAQRGLTSVSIVDEKTSFQFAGEPRFTVLYRDSYTTSHEGLYSSGKLTELKRNTLIDLPALFEFEDGAAAAITEANLQHYAGMYLKKAAEGALVSDFAPLPSDSRFKVKTSLPMVTPWRVMLLGENPGKLFESTTIVSLNEPSRIKDTSWIQPGKTTWHWWNGTEGEPAGFETKLDLRTMKHYVDFCARAGIAYHAVTSTPESDSRPWYHQTQKGFAPGSDSDIIKPRPEIEIEELSRYAREKGVGLRLWVHWKALEKQMDEAFAQYQRWGIRGLMVDFLDRDDQEMVEFSERVLEKAAEHRMHIQFHGVWKPTGRERAWPNLFNHEGSLNLEYLKWSDNPSPEHNLTMPFTRLLAGPMDYHLGGFRAVRREDFKPRGVAPVVLGTRAHHLAMYVIFENPMPQVADFPTAYQNAPGFDWIERVPVTWDETRVLLASTSDHIVVARRSGNDWFIGAMTDWTARELEIPLNFLTPGAYSAEIWSDTAETVNNPNMLKRDRITITPTDKIRAKLASGGGWVAHIRLSVP